MKPLLISRNGASKDRLSGSIRSPLIHAGHMGGLLAMHDSAPATIADYEAWFLEYKAKNDKFGRGCGRHKVIDGKKLHRMVMMRRNGCTYKECATAIGAKTPSVAMQWFAKLPKELQP